MKPFQKKTKKRTGASNNSDNDDGDAALEEIKVDDDKDDLVAQGKHNKISAACDTAELDEEALQDAEETANAYLGELPSKERKEGVFMLTKVRRRFINVFWSCNRCLCGQLHLRKLS